MSELALGTWGLSGDAYGSVDEAEQERVIKRAVDIGFTLVDTSDAYGAGRMERLLGRALAANDDVTIVTKGGVDRTTMPARKRFDREYLRAAVERSLVRLRRERLDVFLLHNPSEATMASGEASSALVDLRSEGKIGRWGASVGDVETGRAALRQGAEVIELAYNLVHSQDLHRLSGEIMVAGAGVLARSTLAYGLLSGQWTKDRAFAPEDHRSERWRPHELAHRIDQIEAVRFLVNADVRTMAGAAVRYVLSNSLVSCAVLGPRTVLQLEDVVREVGMTPIYIRDADLARIPRALEAVGVES